MKSTTTTNALLCDPESGVCEIPGIDVHSNSNATKPTIKPIHIDYFTDPICSSCWGIEPQLRKLKLEYGDLIEIEYHMGGLLPGWDVYNSGGISKPSDVAHHWDEVSRYYNMPIDGDVWLEDPLPSSYPPSIAFKAAQLQDEKKALYFLRRIREMVFMEKKNITRWEHLLSAAIDSKLDADRFKEDYNHKANQLFQEDLQLVRQLGVRGFPTLFFSNAESNKNTVYGFKSYMVFEETIHRLLPGASKKAYDKSWENLFHEFSTLTTREFAELADLPLKDGEVKLNELYLQKKIRKVSTKNGALWIYAPENK